MLTISIAYLVAPFFLFIIILGDREYLPHAAILFLMAFTNILFVDVFKVLDPLSYIQSKEILIKYDGAIAIAMTMFLFKDKLALKQSLLLAFAVLCHTMILYKLTIHSSIISAFFYTWYDELIIMVGILQMVISRNGLISALRNVREHILRLSFYCWCFIKGFSLFKKREIRS